MAPLRVRPAPPSSQEVGRHPPGALFIRSSKLPSIGPVQRIQTIFLRGTAGAGLAVLRLSVTVALIGDLGGAGGLGSCPRTALVAALGLLLCAGFMTSAAAAAAALWTLCDALAGGGGGGLVLVGVTVLQAVALAVIGPGAWSLDARLFGRKQVFSARDGDETSG